MIKEYLEIEPKISDDVTLKTGKQQLLKYKEEPLKYLQKQKRK
jgi:hypothetical protein